jgi:1-deoxy-D-xylulose-5-phosphate reductoisomerase
LPRWSAGRAATAYGSPPGYFNGDRVTRGSPLQPTGPTPQPTPNEAKRLVILGATGSIGRSCAQVIGESPGRFTVAAVACGHDGAALALAARSLDARFAAVADPQGYAELKAGLAGSAIEAAAGPDAVVEAALRAADLVVSGIVGAAGLAPTYAAVSAGRAVALANKETLVCAGDAVMATARQTGARLLPMDSEHNAIFQAIGGRNLATIVRMTITASGGPFRQWSAERIATATRAEALAHPNWAMGPKVTIDSATMMNKGLELIEAHHLFDTPAERLTVVVHPQSIVHGFVAFADGSLIAGLASPDMRTPVAHCLGFPERIPSGVAPPDLAALAKLTFEPVDLDRFPAMALATAALAEGGGAPTALNGANEVAVAAFLEGRIGFGRITRLVEQTLAAMRAAGEIAAPTTVAEALTIHHIARDRATALLA